MANVITDFRVCSSQGGRFPFALFFSLSFFVFGDSIAADANQFDRDQALQISQDAIGTLLGNHKLTQADGTSINLSDLRGKPLLVSMIFTSCHHICPTTTKHIADMNEIAGEALGDDSYNILTIGFDTLRDDPGAMQSFAHQLGIDEPNWLFLSTTAETIDSLSSELGFQYYASPRGYDHLNQVTIVDRQGIVYSQVYGMNFEIPALVEPLKQLVFNRPEAQGRPVAALIDRVRLFCTVYNPATGRYEFDNSLFIQIAISLMIVLGVAAYLIREMRHARRH